MTVEEILELMDELLDKSSSVPFSQKKMIDVEQMREYIDSIRLNLPGEIKRAKDMTRDKKNILTEANKEAEEIVKKAKDEAKKLVAQEEIIKQAADYAKQIAAEANKQAADIVEQNAADGIRCAECLKPVTKRRCRTAHSLGIHHQQHRDFQPLGNGIGARLVGLSDAVIKTHCALKDGTVRIGTHPGDQLRHRLF